MYEFLREEVRKSDRLNELEREKIKRDLGDENKRLRKQVNSLSNQVLELRKRVADLMEEELMEESSSDDELVLGQSSYRIRQRNKAVQTDNIVPITEDFIAGAHYVACRLDRKAIEQMERGKYVPNHRSGQWKAARKAVVCYRRQKQIRQHMSRRKAPRNDTFTLAMRSGDYDELVIGEHHRERFRPKGWHREEQIELD